MGRTRRAPLRGVTPNLAPLADVVIVLLIFFMLGTRFAASEGLLPARLPTDIGTGPGPAPSITPVVRIGLSPSERLDGCRISLPGLTLPPDRFDVLHARLQERLRHGADPAGRIVIAAHPAVKYRHIISVLDACVRAGFRNIQFAVSPEGATGSPAGPRP